MKKFIISTLLLIGFLVGGVSIASAAPYDWFCMQVNPVPPGGNSVTFVPSTGVNTFLMFDGTTKRCTGGILGNRFVFGSGTVDIDLTNQPQSNITNLVSDLANKQDWAQSLANISGLSSISSDMLGLLSQPTTQDAVDAMALETTDLSDFTWDLSAYTNDVGFLTSAPVTSVAGKTGAVSLVKADVGLGNVDNTSDANKPISTATQTALNAKFDTPTGTTAEYVRGDGTLATLPTVAAWSFNNAPSRSLTTGTGATGFQVSSTRNADVTYSGTVTTTATIGGSSAGYIALEIAPTNSTTPSAWIEIARCGNSQTITLAIALQSVQGVSCGVTGSIPAGYYAKLRQVTTAGTPSFSLISQQEVLK